MSIRRIATAAATIALAIVTATACTGKPAHRATTPVAKPTAKPTAPAAHRMPNADELSELAIAKRSSQGLECQLEWDGPSYPGYEAICMVPVVPKACLVVPKAAQMACRDLYTRPARTVKNPDGSSYSDPAGPALVAECTSQYKGQELTDCVRQPE